ncbi:MAG: AGE family epimerase/isomerase [Fibrobacterales bacterium]
MSQLLTAGEFQTRLEDVIDRSTVLADNAMNFWLTKGLDTENGGFHSYIDESGNSQQDSKFLIQQSRYLWTCAYWYSQRDSSGAVKTVCDNHFDFMKRAFYNNGDPAHTVNYNGTTVESWDKVSYAESFFIYGLSEYAISMKSDEAIEMALAIFDNLISRSYDAQNKGYDQTRDGRVFTQMGDKGTNTHLHLLEAFTRLYDYSQNSAVREKLNELLNIFRDHIMQSDNYCGQGFWNNWGKVAEDNSISYGHDIETAWLLYEAVKSLGREGETALVAQIMAMGKRSALEGYDPDVGAYSFGGSYDGNRSNNTKTWWVQFEAIQGLWRLFEHYQDTLYVDRIESTLSWIEGSQMNGATQEWYADVDNGGNAGENRYTANEWKTSYHSVRGVVNLPRWINEYQLGQLCTLTLTSDHGALTVTPQQEVYAKGASVTLSVVSDEGYEFAGWLLETVDSVFEITIVMDSSIAIEALYTESSSVVSSSDELESSQGEGESSLGQEEPDDLSSESEVSSSAGDFESSEGELVLLNDAASLPYVGIALLGPYESITQYTSDTHQFYTLSGERVAILTGQRTEVIVVVRK